jgi:hypothetical protein
LTCSEIKLIVKSPSPLIDEPVIYVRLSVAALFLWSDSP